ncbi:DUF4280 domain-containing protein [Sporomusa sphaeroides]|uniref:DUF4280 domain-containing protein n=2 Tax=Sporomusaceae TaxID=1843490 RepID=UPI002BE25E40|nr:DUF4280 domain-containing protein [Sporomusa sphaeroides]HML34728.1 DUF4280 domain-containing protein [Sporomusa sphaeroides]
MKIHLIKPDMADKLAMGKTYRPELQKPQAKGEKPLGMCVCGGAKLLCSFSMAPSSLVVLPQNRVISTMPVANIMDNKPLVNVMPFGMCSSPANPTVAAATAAALGVLTPMPCIPVIPAPWVPGSATVMIANCPALNQAAKLMCAWGGMIQIVDPGQMTIQIT